MINPKAGYHKLEAYRFGAIGGGIGTNAKKTLEESLGSGAARVDWRHIAEQRRRRLRSLSITTIEEAVGAARAVPEKLADLVGKDVVAVLQSDEFRNAAVETIPALERFPRWEKRRLTFGVQLGKPPPGSSLQGLERERGPARPRVSEFSLVSNGCMPPIRNQGERWTCVAFATCAVVEYAFCVSRQLEVDLSEQYHYWDTKCHDPDGYYTQGTYPQISFSQAKLDGICLEATWPYDMSNDPLQNDPQGTKGRKEAGKYRVSDSIEITNHRDVDSLKALIRDNQAVAVAIPVYDSWSSNPAVYDSGNIGMPLPGETSGYGHALVLVGFADDTEFPGGGYFIIRNSYGTEWGSQCPFGPGYGTIPYGYIAAENLSAFIVRA